MSTSDFNWSWVKTKDETLCSSNSVDQSGGILYTYRTATGGQLSAAELRTSIETISTNINHQWRLWRSHIYPVLDSLPAGNRDERWRPGSGLPDKIDALTYGIQGTTLFVVNDANTTIASGRYWDENAERPKTISEAFEDVWTTITSLNAAASASSESVDLESLWSAVGHRYYDSALSSISTSLDARTGVLASNIAQLEDDIYGVTEGFTPWTFGVPLTYSIAINIDRILKLHNIAGGWQNDPDSMSHTALPPAAHEHTYDEVLPPPAAALTQARVAPFSSLENEVLRLRYEIQQTRGSSSWYTDVMSPWMSSGDTSLGDHIGYVGSGTASTSNPHALNYTNTGANTIFTNVTRFTGMSDYTSGSETPNYSSTYFVTQSTNLEVAIGALDTALYSAASSSFSFDNIYNNESGDHDIEVDDGDINYNLGGVYPVNSFNISLVNAVGTDLQGFQVLNGTDSFQLVRHDDNEIALIGTLESVLFSIEDSVSVTAASDISLIASDQILLNSAGASSWEVTGADLDFTTLASGDINLEAGYVGIYPSGIGDVNITAADAITLIATAENITMEATEGSVGVEADEFNVESTNAELSVEETLSMEAGGAFDLSADLGLVFSWTGLNDCVFDLSNCDNPVESEARFLVSNGNDYFSVERRGADQLAIESYLTSFQMYTSDSFNVIATDDINLNTAAEFILNASGGMTFTWDGLNDCIFDLENCDEEEGEGSSQAKWRVQDGDDYFELAKIEDDQLDLETELDNCYISASGTINLDAGSIVLGGSLTANVAGSCYIYCTNTSFWRTTAANLTLATITSGNVILDSVDDISLTAGADLSFEDQYAGPIDFSESGQTALVGYTATTILGAINEVRKVARYAYIPIEWANEANNDSNPPETSELYVGTTNGAMRVRKFAGTVTTDSVTIPWEVPSDIIAGDGIFVQVVGLITESTAPASGEGVVFKVSGYSVGVGDHIDGTFGTEVETADDDLFASGCTVQGERYKTDLSGEITVTNLAGGETAMLHLERDIAAGDDDYEQDIGAAMLVIKYFEQATIT